MDINVILKNKTDKINFFRGLIRLAKCDCNVSLEEKEYFAAAAIQFELDSNDINNLNQCWDTSEEIEIIFSSKGIGYFFIREGIQLCSVDRKYDDAEKTEIKKLTQELDLDNDKVKMIEDWVERGMNWQMEGDKLIEELVGIS